MKTPNFMKAADLERVLETAHDTAASAFDHLTERFDKMAKSMGDEYADLVEFSAGWKKLSKNARRLFIEQFMKSTVLVLAGAVATKAGVKIAWKKQKLVRNVLLGVADVIEPLAKTTKKKAVKTAARTAAKTKKKLKK